jgi:hypothetical protein
MKKFLTAAVFLCISCEPAVQYSTEGMSVRNSDVFSACLYGIKYYFWDRGLAPAYKPNGNLQRCKP